MPEYTPYVYSFDLARPLGWSDDANECLDKQAAFWNALVCIEEKHRDAVLAVSQEDKDVQAEDTLLRGLSERIDELVGARKALRKEARKRAPTPELDEQIGELRVERRERAAKVKALRKIAREKAKPEIKLLNDRRKVEVKEARNASGLYWGNYNAVAQAYEKARIAVAKKGVRLNERRPNGEGRFHVQIQGGASPSSLLDGTCKLAQLTELPDEVKPQFVARGGRRAFNQVRLLTVRFARNGDGWHTLSWPCYMHRQIDPAATIQEVTVTRRRRGVTSMQAVGGHGHPWHYTVSFLCRMPTKEIEMRPHTACGLDVGWRLIPEGMRVGTYIGTNSDEPKYVKLPTEHLQRYELMERWRSETDASINERVALFLAAPPEKDGDTEHQSPEPLAECIEGLRAAEKRNEKVRWLMVLDERWRDVDWNTEARDEHAKWAAQTRKHMASLRNLARRTYLWRREIYRIAAAEICDEYQHIGVEQIDLAGLARRKSKRGESEKEDMPQAIRRNRQIAGVSELLLAIRSAARQRGNKIHATSEPTTIPCADCGTENRPLDRAALTWTCKGCSVQRDQDSTAGMNLRRFAVEQAHAIDTREVE